MSGQTPNQPPAGGEQTAAPVATGGPLMGELSPFPDDTGGDDDSDFIFNTIFNSDGDQGSKVSSSDSGSTAPSDGAGGGASPPAGADAAAQGAGGTPTPEPAPNQSQSATGATSQSPGAAEAPASSPASTSAPAAGSQPGQGQSPEEKLKISSLEATVTALQQQIERLTAGKPASTSEQPAGQPAAPATEGFKPIAIPNEILEGMMDEDPQKASAAITTLVNGIDVMVRRRVMEQVDQLVQTRVTEALSGMQQQTEAEKIRQRYFTRFADHNKPDLQVIINQQAQRLATEMPNIDWNSDVTLDALGARVNRVLVDLGVQPASMTTPASAPANGGGNQPPAEQPPVATRPAAMSGAGTRPPAPVGDDNFIRQTLG